MENQINNKDMLSKAPNKSEISKDDISFIQNIAQNVGNSITTAFRGKNEVIELVVTALFASGHVLLEDVPGTGKTILARALAKSIDCNFSRIQCTPDLMPADVTGSSVFSPKTQEFSFRPGPIISQMVLVDELNRATPRTQSALLEAMAEGQVSVDGSCHILPQPFFLIATENPVESEGTFPLPEAQKDRFMISLSIGYPDEDNEALIINGMRRLGNPVDDIISVATANDIEICRKNIVNVHVEETVLKYLLTLSNATRQDSRIAVGASPRGSIALYKAAQSYAAINGRNYVIPEDIKNLLLPVYRKRIILKPESIMKGYTTDDILVEISKNISIPAYKDKK